MDHFETVKAFAIEIGLEVVREDAAAQLLVVNGPGRGINDLIIDCEDDILVMEQLIASVGAADRAAMVRLLQMNRLLVHGAFALADDARSLVFRDTLQLRTLDREELAASINALELALAQFGTELLGFAAAGGDRS